MKLVIERVLNQQPHCKVVALVVSKLPLSSMLARQKQTCPSSCSETVKTVT